MPGGASAANPACTSASTTTHCLFTGEGTYSYTVPVGVTSLDVVAAGAAGGASASGTAGGSGAQVEDTAVPVTPGQQLNVVVGSVGGAGATNEGGFAGTYGGGGPGGDTNFVALSDDGDGGAGGGYSGVLNSSNNPLVIAGGGGGSGDGSAGGNGGDGAYGSVGANVLDGQSSGGANGGGGGTNTGGTGGPSANCTGTGTSGGGGSSLAGGNGGNQSTTSTPKYSTGGGGGGGYFGGGGGGCVGNSVDAGGGGGGGSSYGATGLTNGTLATGAASVTISFTQRQSSTSVTCSPSSLQVGQTTTCTATVTDTAAGTASTPTGSVSFSSDSSGSFGSASTCVLSGSGNTASCQVTYTPSAVNSGTHTITAAYSGDTGHVRSSSSTTLAVSQPAPSSKSPPTITGATYQGSTLTEHHGTWTGNPTSYAYQWYDCVGSSPQCSAIPGATAQQYTLTSSDIGYTIRVTETAKNSSGSTIAVTAPSSEVTLPPPVNTAPPTIRGTAKPSDKLTAVGGSWTNNPTGYAYQWYACAGTGPNCVAIPNATGQLYTVRTNDEGETIRVAEIASNAGGSTTAVSSPTSTVPVSAKVQAKLKVGKTLRVAPVTGKVKIKVPASTSLTSLITGEVIPVGSIVDTTHGRVTLISKTVNGKTQSAVFYAGVFKVEQKPGEDRVTLVLVGGAACVKHTLLATIAAAPKGKPKRKLWGSGHGSFTTQGGDAAASVSGTTWLTEDFCNGTLVFAKHDTVIVRDFITKKTIVLHTGQRYFAAAKP